MALIYRITRCPHPATTWSTRLKLTTRCSIVWIWTPERTSLTLRAPRRLATPQDSISTNNTSRWSQRQAALSQTLRWAQSSKKIFWASSQSWQMPRARFSSRITSTTTASWSGRTTPSSRQGWMETGNWFLCSRCSSPISIHRIWQCTQSSSRSTPRWPRSP